MSLSRLFFNKFRKTKRSQYIILIFFFGVLLCSNYCYAQIINGTLIKTTECNIPVKERKKIRIQEVAIGDTILTREIVKLIKEQTEENEMFKKGLGYIYVLLEDRNLEKHIERAYYINVDYTGLKRLSQDPDAYLFYPNYYSFVGNRLVFIKDLTLNATICPWYTSKSARKIRRIQNRYLEKEKRTTLYDMNGKKAFTDKHFRIDFFNIHGGKYIYIYSDNHYEVEDDPYKPKPKQ